METGEKRSLGQSDEEVLVPNPPFNSKFSTAGALGRENAKNGCMFCDGPHPSDSLKIVPSIDQRLEFLHSQKRCQWLCQSVDTWPVWSGSGNHVEHETYQEGMEAMCMATGEPSSSLLNVIDPERYSSLNKLLVVTFHVICITTNYKSGEKKPQNWPLNNLRTINHHDTGQRLFKVELSAMKYSSSLRRTASYLSHLSISCAYILMTMLFFVAEKD